MVSPVNPEVKSSKSQVVSKTLARHSELVIFVLGIACGLILTLLAR